MALIPDDELKKMGTIHWAPMVDFLFVVIAVLATFTLTRTYLFDHKVELASTSAPLVPGQSEAVQQKVLVHLSVDRQGQCKWLEESSEREMENSESVRSRLLLLKSEGALPSQREEVKVLLHIDKEAPWAPIADLILAVRETGYAVYPVYTQMAAKEDF